MKIIFGLGNPGKEYGGTRHNIGFEVLDRLSVCHRSYFREKRLHAEISRFHLAAEEVLLVKPQTFMNQSGRTVREVWDFFKEEIGGFENILVVIDDVALPLGSLRFRSSGRSGGHLGLASILAELATDGVPRLRIGVGMPLGRDMDMADYVLDTFQEDERPLVEETLSRSMDACSHWVSFGSESAMQIYNAKKK